jgi:hypothetical protein
VTLAAEVEGYAAIALLQQRDLGIEHATTPQQAMSKDDSFGAGAMLLVIECCPIHTDDRHADNSFTHYREKPVDPTLSHRLFLSKQASIPA